MVKYGLPQKESPAQRIDHNKWFGGYPTGDADPLPSINYNPPSQSTQNRADKFEWETPQAEYEFGKMRILQQIAAMQTAGPDPVARTPQFSTMSALGGRLVRDDTDMYYQAAQAAAAARFARQMRVLRKNLDFLNQRMKYDYPISDIV